MAKRTKHSKKRIPQLSYSDNRGMGWYVSYRDPVTNMPRKHRFGIEMSREQANEKYNQWLAGHLSGQQPATKKQTAARIILAPSDKMITAETVSGSLVEIASNMLEYDKRRVRPDNGSKAKGTIKQKQYESLYKLAHFFLGFLNKRHGQGAVGRMTLADLTMADVEAFNLEMIQADYSNSQVKKRLQVVQSIINRAGRPEHGNQVLGWNWEARDVYHGRPDKEITLPTVKQLKLILSKCNEQRTALIWMAIGLGFGQSDLAKSRPLHFDKDDYDMRRGKTGVERYGKMQPRVWDSISKYLSKSPRQRDDLLFVTEDGMPLVHGNTDSVVQWWGDTRDGLQDQDGQPAGIGLNGFYSLRHTGATEFGSRPGCSLAAMRGWLGHSISSVVADRYMRPVSPEHKELILWVRRMLQSTTPLK